LDKAGEDAMGRTLVIGSSIGCETAGLGWVFSE